MDAGDARRAVTAAIAVAASQGLTADDAVVLADSTMLAVRVLPCDVFARIAHAGQEKAAFEIELAQRLAGVDAPVAALDPRVAPVVHVRDGFAMTLWTHYEPTGVELSPAEHADALARMHAGLRAIDLPTVHFTERVGEAEALLRTSPTALELAEDDRSLLVDSLQRSRQAVLDRGAPEQLLHGEPHPGNILVTVDGPRFIDLETCCIGPVEYDVAHLPVAVADHYPGLDAELLADCRHLALAVVAGWRCEPGDGLPNGRRFLRELIGALRDGPPWPTIGVVHDRIGGC